MERSSRAKEPGYEARAEWYSFPGVDYSLFVLNVDAEDGNTEDGNKGMEMAGEYICRYRVSYRGVGKGGYPPP